MPRKRSISALLNESPKKSERKNSREKVPCNCNYCNGFPIDPRTKIVHESMQSKKPSDLELNLLTISSQPEFQQEDLNTYTDWPGTEKLVFIIKDSASFKDNSLENSKFTFQPRKHKTALNREAFEPLNEIDITPFDLYSDAEVNIDADAESYVDLEDDISETSMESDESTDEFQDIFEDYLTPSFEFPLNCDSKSTDS